MKKSSFSLKNKISFILGGSGLIGRTVCLEFAKAGSVVCLIDKETSSSLKLLEELKKINSKCSFFQLDCSDFEQLEENFNNLLKSFSIPHIFVNCSYPRTKDWANNSFKDVTLESYRKNIDIHLNSYSWTAKMVADEMIKDSIKGSIILTSSIYGSKAQDLSMYKDTNIDENMTYPIIKSGIIHLSKQMASYYGNFGIRINTVSPGGLEGRIAGKSSTQDATFKKRYINKTPMKRMTRPDDVAHAMIFLASEASSYITGNDIKVDGGISVV